MYSKNCNFYELYVLKKFAVFMSFSRDHSSITSACFWLFWPTHLRQHKSYWKSAKIAIFWPQSPTRLLADVIIKWSPTEWIPVQSANCWPNGRGSPKICISNDTKSNVTFGLNELWSLKSLFANLFCSVVDCSIQDTRIVFFHIVSAETIHFWIWKSKGHST